MEYRSLVYKYWVEFDDDGEIKEVHRSKYDCKSCCNEYIVKLIPIKRSIETDVAKNVKDVTDNLARQSKLLETEFKKAIKTVKGVLR